MELPHIYETLVEESLSPTAAAIFPYLDVGIGIPLSNDYVFVFRGSTRSTDAYIEISRTSGANERGWKLYDDYSKLSSMTTVQSAPYISTMAGCTQSSLFFVLSQPVQSIHSIHGELIRDDNKYYVQIYYIAKTSGTIYRILIPLNSYVFSSTGTATVSLDSPTVNSIVLPPNIPSLGNSVNSFVSNKDKIVLAAGFNDGNVYIIDLSIHTQIKVVLISYSLTSSSSNKNNTSSLSTTEQLDENDNSTASDDDEETTNEIPIPRTGNTLLPNSSSSGGGGGGGFWSTLVTGVKTIIGVTHTEEEEGENSMDMNTSNIDSSVSSVTRSTTTRRTATATTTKAPAVISVSLFIKHHPSIYGKNDLLLCSILYDNAMVYFYEVFLDDASRTEPYSTCESKFSLPELLGSQQTNTENFTLPTDILASFRHGVRLGSSIQLLTSSILSATFGNSPFCLVLLHILPSLTTVSPVSLAFWYNLDNAHIVHNPQNILLLHGSNSSSLSNSSIIPSWCRHPQTRLRSSAIAGTETNMEKGIIYLYTLWNYITAGQDNNQSTVPWPVPEYPTWTIQHTIPLPTAQNIERSSSYTSPIFMHQIVHTSGTNQEPGLSLIPSLPTDELHLTIEKGVNNLPSAYPDDHDGIPVYTSDSSQYRGASSSGTASKRARGVPSTNLYTINQFPLLIRSTKGNLGRLIPVPPSLIPFSLPNEPVFMFNNSITIGEDLYKDLQKFIKDETTSTKFTSWANFWTNPSIVYRVSKHIRIAASLDNPEVLTQTILWCSNALLMLCGKDRIANAVELAANEAIDGTTNGSQSGILHNRVITLSTLVMEETNAISQPNGAGKALPRLKVRIANENDDGTSNTNSSVRTADPSYVIVKAPSYTDIRTQMAGYLLRALPHNLNLFFGNQIQEVYDGTIPDDHYRQLVNARLLPPVALNGFYGTVDPSGTIVPTSKENAAYRRIRPSNHVLVDGDDLPVRHHFPDAEESKEDIGNTTATNVLPLFDQRQIGYYQLKVLVQTLRYLGTIEKLFNENVPDILAVLGILAGPLTCLILAIRHNLQGIIHESGENIILDHLERKLTNTEYPVNIPVMNHSTALITADQLQSLRDTWTGLTLLTAPGTSLQLQCAYESICVHTYYWLSKQVSQEELCTLDERDKKSGSSTSQMVINTFDHVIFPSNQKTVSRTTSMNPFSFIIQRDEPELTVLENAIVEARVCGCHTDLPRVPLVPFIVDSALSKSRYTLKDPTAYFIQIATPSRNDGENSTLDFSGISQVDGPAQLYRYLKIVDHATRTLVHLRQPHITAEWIARIAPAYSLALPPDTPVEPGVRDRDRAYLHVFGISRLYTALIDVYHADNHVFQMEHELQDRKGDTNANELLLQEKLEEARIHARDVGQKAATSVAEAIAAFRLLTADWVRTFQCSTVPEEVQTTALRNLYFYCSGLDDLVQACGFHSAIIAPMLQALWEALPRLRKVSGMAPNLYVFMADKVQKALFEACMPAVDGVNIFNVNQYATSPLLSGAGIATLMLRVTVFRMCRQSDAAAAYRYAMSMEIPESRRIAITQLLRTLVQTTYDNQELWNNSNDIKREEIKRIKENFRTVLLGLPFTKEDFTNAKVPPPFELTYSLGTNRLQANAAEWKALAQDASNRHAKYTLQSMLPENTVFDRTEGRNDPNDEFSDYAVRKLHLHELAASAASTGAYQLRTLLEQDRTFMDPFEAFELARECTHLFALALESMGILKALGGNVRNLVRTVIEIIPRDDGLNRTVSSYDPTVTNSNNNNNNSFMDHQQQYTGVSSIIGLDKSEPARQLCVEVHVSDVHDMRYEFLISRARCRMIMDYIKAIEKQETLTKKKQTITIAHVVPKMFNTNYLQYCFNTNENNGTTTNNSNSVMERINYFLTSTTPWIDIIGLQCWLLATGRFITAVTISKLLEQTGKCRMVRDEAEIIQEKLRVRIENIKLNGGPPRDMRNQQEILNQPMDEMDAELMMEEYEDDKAQQETLYGTMTTGMNDGTVQHYHEINGGTLLPLSSVSIVRFIAKLITYLPNTVTIVNGLTYVGNHWNPDFVNDSANNLLRFTLLDKLGMLCNLTMDPSTAALAALAVLDSSMNDVMVRSTTKEETEYTLDPLDTRIQCLREISLHRNSKE